MKKPVKLGGFAFEFAETTDASIPTMIHLIPIGEWKHDLYGDISITASDIRQFAQNFNAGIRNGVYITAGHEGMLELPAQGWITRVECRETGLWGEIDWNDLGRTTLSDKQYKFFSPEFYREYEDPETHEQFKNVLTGGALTKSPYFKELEAIVFSEKIRSFNDNNTMDLATILAKDVSAMSEDEKAFIKAHAAELTEDQKAQVTSIIDAPESPEEKEVREAKEQGDANEAAGLNRDGSAKTTEEDKGGEIAASEKVMITAGELALLRSKADKGEAAFAELKKAKITASVKAHIFNESNKTGKFLPKCETSLRAFMESLDDAQVLQFNTLVATGLPKAGIFTEVGSDAAIESTGLTEVERRTDAKMVAAEKAGKPMKYSDALKEVMSEAAGKGENLQQSYDDALPKAGKVTA